MSDLPLYIEAPSETRILVDQLWRRFCDETMPLSKQAKLNVDEWLADIPSSGDDSISVWETLSQAFLMHAWKRMGYAFYPRFDVAPQELQEFTISMRAEMLGAENA